MLLVTVCKYMDCSFLLQGGKSATVTKCSKKDPDTEKRSRLLNLEIIQTELNITYLKKKIEHVSLMNELKLHEVEKIRNKKMRSLTKSFLSTPTVVPTVAQTISEGDSLIAQAYNCSHITDTDEVSTVQSVEAPVPTSQTSDTLLWVPSEENPLVWHIQSQNK